MMTYITIGQSQRDKETGEPYDATSIKYGSEGDRGKRPAMDLARGLPSDKHRHRHQAKGAGRLELKGHCSGYKDSPIPCHGHHTLPVERARLTHPCVTETEHGNPVRLPQGKASRKASR